MPEEEDTKLQTPETLRRMLSHRRFHIALGLFALYLALGFLILPALLKWQLEKQLGENLGHRISVGAVRFNPLALRLEIRALALSDPDGSAMFGFKRLLVDFEARSLFERAWTFSEASLEEPALRFALAQGEGHNFSPLLERLGGGKQEPAQQSSDLPRLIVDRLTISAGRIEYADARLDDPLVSRIEPLQFEIDQFSTLPDTAAPFRLSARTMASESLETTGKLALRPFALKGQLSIGELTVATLARALSRVLALHSPKGQLGLSGKFDLALAADGALGGELQDLALDLDSVSISAAQDSAPLLAIRSLSVKQASVDLDQRQVTVAGVRLANSSIAAAVDEQGGLDWAKLSLAPATASEQAPAEPGSGAPSDQGAAAAPWRVTLARAEIAELALNYANASDDSSAQAAALGLELAARAEFGGQRMRVDLEAPKLTLAGAHLKRGAELLGVPGAQVEARQIAITSSAAEGLELTLEAARVSVPDGFSARAGETSAEVHELSADTGAVALKMIDSALTATFTTPEISAAGLSNGGPEGARIAKLAIGSGKVALQSGPQGLELKIDKAQASLAELRMERAADGIKLDSASLAGETLSLAQADGLMRIGGDAVEFALGPLGARQAGNRLALQGANISARSWSAVSGGPGAKLEARIEDAGLQLKHIGVVAQGASAEIGRVGDAQLAAKSLALKIADGPPELNATGLTATLRDTLVSSPVDGSELLRLASATLAGGSLGLRERVLAIEQLGFRKGAARTALDARGNFNWLALAGPGPQAEPTADAPATAGGSEASWRVTVKSLALDDFALSFADRRRDPAFATGVEAMRVRVAGLDSGSAQPMQLDFAASIPSGGKLAAKGGIRADNGAADLTIRIADVELLPVQPYLSEFATLRLASGALSAEGRLRVGEQPGSEARLGYQGSLAITRLRLDETAPPRPFFAWTAVASNDVVLTLGPDRLDIGELTVDGPTGRLVIAEDQTINLTDVIRKPEPGDAAADSAAQQGKTESAPFPVSVARIRVTKGALDFADLSLRPRFGARMHDLKGVVTGVGTDPEGSTQLQLDANVDSYGSARIRGNLNLLRPEKATAVDVAFRNLEMTSLSPYVAKFAGYKIAGGKLALDLQYRVEDGKLQGENKVVLNQVELGEKVDSPSALDLPLELALAILKDAQGVIDIALPVSGDLGDPQFDYGAVIAKAVGSLIGGVVSAPFRALGALLGAGTGKLDTVAFDPGTDSLAPPERDKLDSVARALHERPALRLKVPPTYASAHDRPALKSLAVRSQIVRQMGIELAAGEDPGPLDVGNARVQRALESSYRQRHSAQALAALKREGSAAAAPAPTAAGQQADAPALPAALYQRMLDQLIDQQAVPDQALAELAQRRGAAIVKELTTHGGLPEARVAIADAREAADSSTDAVIVHLELEVAK